MKHDLMTTDAPQPAVIGEPGFEYCFEFYAPDESSSTGLHRCSVQGFWSVDCDWAAAVRSMWRFSRSLKCTPSPAVPPDKIVTYPPEPLPVQPKTRRAG